MRTIEVPSMKVCDTTVKMLAKIIVCVVFLSIQIAEGSDYRCTTNLQGTCQTDTLHCDGHYESGLCDGDASRKCCVHGSDYGCTNLHGTCQTDSLHCNGQYQSGLCDGAANRRCCVHGSSSGTACHSANAKRYACDLLAWHKAGKIHLWTLHPSGVHDNAYALNNIQDTCHGKAAARSGYKCSLCASPAPGGHVCLSETLLHYLHTLAGGGHKYIHVNEIAGACHHCGSAHYKGTAVDLDNGGKSAARVSEFMHLCRSMGGFALDEGNHIHCNF